LYFPRSSVSSPRPWALLGALALSAIVRTEPASAADCGDNVGGKRIACSCGDTVVTSTTLTASDPVTKGRCHLDGLIVRAAEFEDSLVLDLAGLSIVGSGVGTGIDVRAGGSEGAAIIGGPKSHLGEVVGFGVGVRVREGGAIRRIEALDIEGHRHEGLALHTAGAMLVNVTLARNGGDGAQIIGQGGRLIDVRAIENRSAGLRISARDVIVEARAERNRGHGIVAGGIRTDLTHSYAGYNQGSGVVVAGAGSKFEDVVAEGNQLAGIVHRKEMQR
jgi:hypothetical protein